MNTKIIATIGPHSEKPEVFFKLVEAGVDIVRVNFSHATFPQFSRVRKLVNQASKKFKRKIYLMQDLCGPRMRVGKLPEEGVPMNEGSVHVFCFHKDGEKDAGIISINDPYLHLDIKKGEPLYLSNGDIELVVTKLQSRHITARVVRGGVLFSNKAINVPRTNLRRSGLTTKDIKDAKFAIREGVHIIAPSFVGSSQDIFRLRKLIGSKKIRIVAKIERLIGLQNLDSIIQASDAVMVCRGDLGIEVPQEDLPIIQKQMIRQAHWHKKGVIVATQMMMSMMDHPRPTRAEVSDVANAVFDGTDVVMLSEETAMGKYSVETVKTMRSILKRTEDYVRNENYFI